MPTPILATKLYIPQPRPGAILRPRLAARLDAGLRGKLTLISAAAGFGKTTLLSSWLHELPAAAAGDGYGAQHIAWLALDKADSDPARFLLHLIAALQTVAPQLGADATLALQAPQPPPLAALMATLVNEIAALTARLLLVLDDYHLVESQAVDEALGLLIAHLPPQLHLVISTREDPPLPLARLRAQGHLAELRAADLRFTTAEATAFLNQTMGLRLSAESIAALDSRTEGWIAGLHLAALSLQGQADAAAFIASFTGSHRFVLDYLLEEVLHQQPAAVQRFLLQTAILERLCGPLCEAVVGAPAGSGQATLAALEHANLFIVPLDNERRWYRYHHLFADLLRQRLQQQVATEQPALDVAALHVRASTWYESSGLQLEAFQHAAAANDLARAERLIYGPGMPLHAGGTVAAILGWLGTLPAAVLDAWPSLWVRYGTTLLVTGQTTGVAEKLRAAELALQDAARDDATLTLLGQIAAGRATLALTQYQLDAVIEQSQRALEYLRPSDLSFRATANWTLGFAYQAQGDRAAARRTFTEALTLSAAAADVFTTILAALGLGQIQEADGELHLAAATYRRALDLAGTQPQQIIYEAHLGLARLAYEWNDLAAAELHGEQSLQLARQYESVIDRFVVCEVFLARLKLAAGDVDGAAALLSQTEQAARQRNFLLRLPEIADVQVLTLVRQGKLAAAAQRAQSYALPLSQARVALAQGDPTAALQILEPLIAETAARGWHDERLRALVLAALAQQALGATAVARQLMGAALALAAAGGAIRVFVDEGAPMRQLLGDLIAHGAAPEHARTVLAAFAPGKAKPAQLSAGVESLSERELEVLQHIAAGRTDREIGERLHLSVYTVKVHARNIYGKLAVNRRTQAVARARELGLLPRE